MLKITDSVNSSPFFVAFVIVSLAKLILLVYFSVESHEIFGGGNDSHYYEAYTLGRHNVASNLWPVILRGLYQVGLYSRTGITVFLMAMNIIVLPFVIARICVVKRSSLQLRTRTYWLAAAIVSAYPTLFYYSLDIYRDIFMMLIFVAGLVVVKNYQGIPFGMKKMLLLFCVFAIIYFLYLLRPYLGFSFFAALLLYKFYSFKKYPFILSVFIYLIVLNVLYFLGLFGELMQYRTMFVTYLSGGGSNLGIVFDSNGMFIPSLVKSFIFQVLGMFFVNLSSIFVFCIESVPFIFALYYLVRNRRFSNAFVDYLIVFCVAYSTIWLLGNDNLGTGVRLRMFTYIPVLIACLMIYQNKIMGLRNTKYLA